MIILPVCVFCPQCNVSGFHPTEQQRYWQEGQEINGGGERVAAQALCDGQEEDQWHLRAARGLHQGELRLHGGWVEP